MADDSTTPDADAAAEEARAKAEARRQRILEKSSERMGVVVGGKAPKEQSEDDSGDGGEPPGASAQPSGASRMQAMRRRRFKKTTPSDKKEASETKEMETTAQSTTAKETKEGTETTTVTADETPKQTATEAETARAEALPVPQTETGAPASQATEENTAVKVSAETKKKYKGVAKMRREMIKKKEMEEAQAEAEEPKAVSSVPLLRKAPVSRIPILIHLFAVLLLFCAGVDIGWNQVVLSDVTIYRYITPRQDGVGLVNRYMSSSFFQSTTVLDPSVLQETKKKKWWSRDSRDEFVSSEQEEDDVDVPNIDPLFRVDLDKLTEGGGLFNSVARGAINIHRLILKIFCYLPLSIMQTLAGIPQQLLTTPPILCIVSLLVRQTSKLVFGAKLPDPAMDKKDSKDVLAMMKQGIANFLAGMFPTAVTLYDVWTHLRSDMYVILCGVFCGLAYSHYFLIESGDDRVIMLPSSDEL